MFLTPQNVHIKSSSVFSHDRSITSTDFDSYLAGAEVDGSERMTMNYCTFINQEATPLRVIFPFKVSLLE